MNFVCPYFSPEGMVMLTSRVRGHFVAFIYGLHSQKIEFDSPRIVLVR